MSSLVKEDLAKRLFGPRRQRLHEFIEVEGAGAQRYYLCAAASPSSRMKATVCSHKTVYKLQKNIELKCSPIQGFSQPGIGEPKKECTPKSVPLEVRRIMQTQCLNEDFIAVLVNSHERLLKKDSSQGGQVTKSKEVEICMVKHWRVDREEKYEIVEKWFLKDLEMIDGKEADTDNPYFDMHFHKVYNMEAYSCASKYTFARTLNKLNATYLKKDFKIVNFDDTYLNDDSIWSSSNRDFLVVMRVCFYASNLLCLSLCRLS